MNTKKLHEKRRKRTSLRKADQYRADAEFHRKRTEIILLDSLELKKNVLKSDEARVLLKKESSELVEEISSLRNELAWIKKLWVVRLALLFVSYK